MDLTEDIQDLKNSLRNSIDGPLLEEMKQFVIDFAREINLDTGQVLEPRSLRIKTAKLSLKQQDALLPAIETLTEKNVFENCDGKFLLTEKGRELIYNYQ